MLLPCSKAQNPLLFDKYYNVGYVNSYNNNVIVLPDSTYLFSSYYNDSASSRLDHGLFKLDKYGNLLSKKLINYNNLPYLRPSTSYNNIVKISNSSLMMVATTIVNSKWAMIFSKLNAHTADTVKTLLFCDSVNFYGVGNLMQIHPNKYFAIGNKEPQPYTQRWPVVIELDSNLTIVNTTNCNNPNNFITFFANYFSNQKIIIGGTVQLSNILYPFIAEIDTLGVIKKHVIMNDTIHGISQVFYNSFNTSYYTIGGLRSSIYGNTNMYKICVTKFDTALNMQWQKTYANANYTTNAYDAVVNTDGSMVLVGRYSDSLYQPVKNVNTNAFMLKINADGDSLWMRQFDNINDTTHTFNTYLEAFWGIEKTPEGGYIMCGNAQQQPKSQAWVVKTDSMGCVIGNCNNSTAGLVSSSAIENTFSIYPNPANERLNISLSPFDSAQGDKKEIKIINVLGEVVSSSLVESTKHSSIDISHFYSGIYFISVYNNKTLLGTKKIIKE